MMRKYGCLERLYYYIVECRDIANERNKWIIKNL